MKFVIKTMDRAIELKQMTYAFLKKHGVEDKDIDLFVSKEKDVDYYNFMFPDCNIIKGPMGIVPIDNFIVDYYPEGEKYIYLNDDIKRLYYAPDKKSLRVIDDFMPLVEETFKMMEDQDITYAGLNPVDNPYFMRAQPEFKYGLSIITDPFSFVINNKNIKLTQFYINDNYNDNSFSDYEKSILHYLDKKKILRLNWYSVDVLYFNGASTSNRTKENCQKTAELMMEKYPEYITSIKHNKNGFKSLRLKRLGPFI